MPIDRARINELFPVKKKYLYFNFASDGPLPAPSRDAVCDAASECSEEGLMCVPKQIAVFEDMRHELSILFNSKPENFAYIRHTSEGVLLALLALEINENDNYIVAEDAFPTTVKIMDSHCKGEMRSISINSPVPIMEQIEAVIDGNTKAIVLDWVHFFTGKVIPVREITELARRKNIFTIIDGIQGAGALTLDLDESNIDFFMCGGHKWLLSPQGSGFIFVSPNVWERVKRKSFGWLGCNWKDFSDFTIKPELREGATVMEYGTRSYIPAAAFRETLRIFNSFGIGEIHKHNQGLKNHFIEEITRKGYETIRNENSAPIVPFRTPRIPTPELLNRLREQKVVLSLRNGYIRSGFHFMNDIDEVNKFIALLP